MAKKLYGTDPDQVPTNADLGTMAYQDKDHVKVGSFTSNGIDDNATSTAMTLDSNGNLLVGKTAATISTDGAEMRPTGEVVATTNGLNVAYFYRRSSNGSIAEFRSNGATAGVIGSELYNGDLYIGNSDTGVIFHDGNDAIQPFNPSTNGFRDAAIDLGFSGTRFKDLYLSGGVYLGGTDAANKLEDYETGTWTPVYQGNTSAGTATYTRQAGTYVKVGDLVYAACTLGFTGHTATGSVIIAGLPFTALSSSGNYAGISVSFNSGHSATANYQIGGFIQVGQSDVRLYEFNGGSQQALAVDANVSELDFSIVYRAT